MADGGKQPPYVLCCRHPGGEVAVATIPRNLEQNGRAGLTFPLADVTLDVGELCRPVGIFGEYRSLTLTTTSDLSGKRILAQDLAGMAVIGSRGSGKTLMLKHLQSVVPKQTSLEFFSANCRHYNTSFKILAHLLGEQLRGSSLPEYYERFLAKCRGKTVVVLDEIDLMSPKDRNGVGVPV